jgi:hypothetical protein
MDDFVSMQVLQGRDHLDDKALNFKLMESLSPPKYLIQSLVAAQFE